ncbi:hypothetical protein CLV92_106230 [Kineococcus xinjiangensis]|uniref:Integral membrane protein n=1 Tax=Kineococcus xinjiangensis TaxID=512762 RepID=A0A2S6IME5_9ACTN|nr:hypothetical protein [Kineococcus xinjiangensis]PPK95407.1 hypothetical protein CLV92_106230 [Kineococcus xinjiangensis]
MRIQQSIERQAPAAGRRAGGHTPLRAAVRANVAFSATTGVLAVAGAPVFARHLGDVGEGALAGLGAALVLFAATVALLGWRSASARLGRVLAVLDAAWVAGSAVVLLVAGARFTTAGVLAVVGTSAAVGVLAVLEWRRSGGTAPARGPAPS